MWVGLRAAGSATALALLLALPVSPLPFEPQAPVVPLPRGSTIPFTPADLDWAPKAWHAGHAEGLTLLEAALVVAGVSPADPEAADIQRQLRGLSMYPPEYEHTARVLLTAMAQARFHQEQALAGLSPSQKALVITGEGSSKAREAALEKVDHAQMLQAASALVAAASRVAGPDQVSQQIPADGFGAALAQNFGRTIAAPVSDPGPVTPETLATKLGIEGDVSLAAQVPPAARSALVRLLHAVEPLRGGPPHEASSLRLASTMDAVAPALQAWASAVLLQRLSALQDGIELPDVERPSLQWGLPELPAPEPAEFVPAMTALAILYSPELAATVEAQSSSLEPSLTAGQRLAIGTMLEAMHGYVEAWKVAASHSMPEGLALPEDLGAWEPNATELSQFAQALPGLQAAWDAVQAQQALLAAADAIPPAFASAAPCSQPEVRIAFILSIDACGHDSTWTQDVLLSIDVGGADAYNQRAAAPFGYDPAPDVDAPAPRIALPMNVLIDLSGNDTYQTTEECSQAAACPSHPIAAQDPIAVAAPNSDPVSLSSTAPVSILLDINTGDTINRFTAGRTSQAFAGPALTTPRLAGTNSHLAPMAVLLETIAAGGALESRFEAGERSQGSATSGGGAARLNGGHAVLLRVSGNDTTSSATFIAGKKSQGAADPGGVAGQARPSFAALVNVAGRAGVANDSYTAGALSQGAIDVTAAQADDGPTVGAAQALFIDAAGAASTSDDAYSAETQSRGYLQDAGAELRSARALFIDAIEPTVQPEAQPGSERGLRLRPSARSVEASNDTYSGPIQAMQGYGWRQDRGRVEDDLSGLSEAHPLPVPAFLPPEVPRAVPEIDALEAQDNVRLQGGFIDLGGEDVYHLPSSWDGEAPESKPRNDASWQRGLDVSFRDRDGDGWPAIAESLWPAWHTDDASQDRTILPTGVLVAIEPIGLPLDGSWATVISVAGDDTYAPGFSATLHIDISGKDRYEGQTAAAAGLADAPQHPLVLHWDLAGDDHYETSRTRAQAFAEGGATALLVDSAGSDTYRAPAFAQAVAIAGNPALPSLAILADLGVPGLGEHNVFAAAFGQGHVEGPTARAVLIATGDHNEFPSDPTAGRINAGTTNADPVVDAILHEPADAVLVAGTRYNFVADVIDGDGDALQACWSFQHGKRDAEGQDAVAVACAPVAEGRATMTFAWDDEHQVHTEAGHRDRASVVNYTVGVVVTDSVGASGNASLALPVANPPPRISGPPQGPLVVSQGEATAYQLLATGETNLTTQVVWGDGASSRSRLVDWALSKFGASTHLAEAGPVLDESHKEIASRILRSVNNQGQTHRLIIDGDPNTSAGFATSAANPLVHLGVQLAGPRQIGMFGLRGSTSISLDFVLEGETPNGDLLHLADFTLDGPFAIAQPLADGPTLVSLTLRQRAPTNPGQAASGQLVLSDFNAYGPGASHTWTKAGTWVANFTAIDNFGGRNQTRQDIVVLPALIDFEQVLAAEAGSLGNLPALVSDVAGRGPVRHATLATLPPGLNDDPAPGSLQPPDYTFTFVGTGPGRDCIATSNCLVIDWADGNQSRLDVPSEDFPVQVTHGWSTPGDYLVRAWVENAGIPLDHVPAFHIHAEAAFELRNGPQSLLLLALDAADVRTSWRSVPAPLALVDAAGNDRYTGAWGAVGAVLGPAQQTGLVVDLDGDDDYLSVQPGTQGFGANTGLGALLDFAGDDLYIAPSDAQGAARGHGVGILADLAGDDRFNPVAPGHPDVPRASPTKWIPWLERPANLTAPRSNLAGPVGDLMQGASEDGLGLLWLEGGHDMLVASTRSQGHSGHESLSLVGYTTPGRDFCPAPDVPPSQATAECMLGVSDIGERTCNFASVQVPCADTNGLQTFLASGPRLGPALGLLHAASGSATYYAHDMSQGSALHGGRGILIDSDGAALLAATSHAQGHARGGLAAAVLAGPAGSWLDRRGHGTTQPDSQGPEPLPGSSAFVVSGTDTACLADCGTPATVQAAETVQLAWETGSGIGTGLAVASDSIVARFSARDASSAPLEVIALSQPAAASASDRCTGAAIAPASILLHEKRAEQGSFSFELDVSRQLEDGPLLPAGCHRVRVYARTVDGPWSALAADAVLHPRPTIEVVGWPSATGLVEVSAPPGRLDLHLRLREPLLAMRDLPTSIVLTQDGQDPPMDWSASTTPWATQQDGSWVKDVALDVPEPGRYRLDVTSGWSVPTTWPLADLDITAAGPTFTLGPLSPSWKGTQAIAIAGTADDQGRGLTGIDVRLVRATNTCLQSATASCVLNLYLPHRLAARACLGHDSQANIDSCAFASTPSFPRGIRPKIECPDRVCTELPSRPLLGEPIQAGKAVAAILKADSGAATKWHWSTHLQAADDFTGGLVTLQARAKDRLGNGAWESLANLLIDRDAPRIVALELAEGGTATNTAFPVRVRAQLSDCAAAGPCTPGSGINASTVRLFVHGDDALQALRHLTTDGSNFTFQWTGDGAPATGKHAISLRARDQAGNLLALDPGTALRVDREPPVLLNPGPSFAAPPGQAALKPGDMLAVRVNAVDHPQAASGLEAIHAEFLGNVTPLVQDPSDPIRWEAALRVPLPPNGTPALHDGHVSRVNLTLLDQAGNRLSVESSDLVVYPAAPVLTALKASVRDTSAELEWASSHPDTIVKATAWIMDQPERVVNGTHNPPGLLHRVSFVGLDENATYEIEIQLRDPAGHQRRLGNHSTLHTLPSVDTLVGVTAPLGTISRTHNLDVVLEGALPGVLRVLRGPEEPPIRQIEVCNEECPANQTLTIEVDTAEVFPESRRHAVAAALLVQFEAGPSTIETTVPIMVDNAPPRLQPTVQGAPPHGPWFNRSVVIESGAADDTHPMVVTGNVSVEGGPASADRLPPLRIEEDGRFLVRFSARDSAIPPNTNHTQIVVQVDRTEPALNLTIANNITAEHNVTLLVLATEPSSASGIDSFRLTVGPNATAWSPLPPEMASLPHKDGSHRITLQVRDKAGNVATRSAPVLVDTLPPEVLRLAWFDTPTNGTHRLSFAARDTIGAEVRPAGIAAVRWVSDTLVSEWNATDGIGTIDLPAGVSLVQFIDLAGNIGPETAAPSRPVAKAAAVEAIKARPGAWLARDLAVAPAIGAEGQPFLFSVVVAPWEGQPPDVVQVVLNGRAYNMTAKGEPTNDGVQLYGAELTLEPTRLGKPHAYHVRLQYGGFAVETPASSGPIVTGGNAAEEKPHSSPRIPGPGAPLLILFLAIALRRRSR